MTTVLLAFLFLIEMVLLDWLVRRFSTAFFWLATMLVWYLTARTLYPN